jgi:hypothetical protein
VKQYPEIARGFRSDGRGYRPDVPIYAFDKLDGSNVRAEASRKTGFYKFGRRHGLLDDSNPLLKREVEPLIRAKYEDDLMKIVTAQRWERAIFYFEFWGPNSFAGNHADEPHTVTLFDVDVFKRGLLEPREFLRLFEHLDTPPVLYTGKCNQPFVESVVNSTLEGMSLEGVVCKGANDKKTKQPVMFKVKSRAWLDKLKAFCGDDEALYQKLL